MRADVAALKNYDIKNASGAEKFLAVSASLPGATTQSELTVEMVRSNWRKTTLGIKYHSAYKHRAHNTGWIESISKKGAFTVSNEGLRHLSSIANSETSTLATNQGLYIFNKSKTHSFDRFAREQFNSAGEIVRIADPYSNKDIFDNLLDNIPEKVKIRLLHGRVDTSCLHRMERFSTEFKKFNHRKSSSLHDRFFIVDSKAFVVGPSLKDAAKGSAAIVVRLSNKDSEKLINHFDAIWKNAR